MKSFFWVVLSLLLFGLLARIDIGGGGILAIDILLPVFTTIWLGRKLIFREKIQPLSWGVCAGLFLFWAFITFWFGAADFDTKPFLLSFAYVFRLVQFLLFGFAARDLFGDLKNSWDFFASFFRIVFGVLLLGIIQFYVLPDISDFSTEGGWDPHIGRLLGTWLDPNYLAGFFGFVIPLVLAFFCQAIDEKKNSRVWGLGILLFGLVFGLFLTFSRSGYLAAGMGIFLFFLFRNPKVLLIGFLGMVLAISLNDRAQKRVEELSGTFSAILFQQTDEIDPTASLRLQNWKKSVSLFEKNPIMGIGYNTYRYKAAEEGIVDESYFSAGGADSTHLTVLVTMGLVGIFLYVLWIFRMIGRQLFLFFRTKKYRWIHLGAFAGGISLFLHASFVNSLFFPLIFVPVVAVFGVLDRTDG